MEYYSKASQKCYQTLSSSCLAFILLQKWQARQFWRIYWGTEELLQILLQCTPAWRTRSNKSPLPFLPLSCFLYSISSLPAMPKWWIWSNRLINSKAGLEIVRINVFWILLLLCFVIFRHTQDIYSSFFNISESKNKLIFSPKEGRNESPRSQIPELGL